MTKRILQAFIVLAIGVWHGSVVLAETQLIFQDEFDFFELDEIWGAGEAVADTPDVMLEASGGILQMVSSGLADEFFGVQMFDAIPLAGLTNITVDARVQPINAGVEGTVAAAEVALIGSSGETMRAFASNNAGPDPESMNDWADHYADSKENTATSGPWPHCDLACDAPRNLVLTVDTIGTTFQTFNDNTPDVPVFEASVDSFTISDFGGGFTISLRQLAVLGGDDAIGNFDSVTVTTEIFEGVSGDFDGNGSYDSVDVDALVAEIAGNTNDGSFDLTGDSLVDQNDLQAWLSEAGAALGFADSLMPGDANLDGNVNATDLNALAVNWLASVAAWSAGDFTADGLVNAGDLNLLGVNWQSSVPIAAASSVPEPSSVLLLILGGFVVAFRRRPLG